VQNEPNRTSHHWCRQHFYELGDITLKGVKNSSKGSGATPRGRSRAPTETRPRKYSLHSSASAQMETRGLLSRISVRSILTDDIIRLPVRKSRPPTRCSTHSSVRSSTDTASKTERVSSESIRARAPTSVEYGNRLEQIGRSRAQGRRPLPDARTGARAFNAPVAFPPNTPVTGSVIGNRHPSRHSFCSLPHQTNQSMSGRRKQGWNV